MSQSHVGGVPGDYFGRMGPRIPFASGSTLLKNLVSWWDLDEESGTRVDAVGSNDLTDVNTVLFTSGKIGNAAIFVGANSEKLSQDPGVVGAFNGDVDWTMACWVKPGVNETAWVAGRYWGVWRGWNIQRDANRFYVQVRNSADDATTIVYDPIGDNYVAGTWYLVIAWHDSTADTVNISREPTSTGDGSGAHSTGCFTNSLAPFNIGGNTIYDNNEMDLVGLWDRVLTSDERTELYNLGASIKNEFTDNGEGFRQGLISYWTMEETGGTRADSVGGKTLSDLNTCLFTASGKTGNAASFVRANSETLYSADDAFDPQDTSFTLAFWYNPANIDATADPVSLASSGANQAWIWRVNTNGSVFFYAWNAAAEFKSGCNLANGTIEAGAWHFVIVQYDASNDTRYTSVNDGTPDSEVVESGFRTGGTANFNIGGRSGAYTDSDIDEVSYYNRVLSSAEITALYNLGAGRFYDFKT